MDRSLAEKLVAELERHPPLTYTVLEGRRDKLIDALAATDVPPSKRFYEEVKPNQEIIHDSAMDQTHFLSIRRVLRNDLVRDYRLSKIKEIYEAVASISGLYDSDALTRKLRASNEIVNIIAQSESPFSLLAKLETSDNFSGKFAVRPLVIIPNVADLSKILEWEDANTKYVQKGLFGTSSKISREKYLKYV